MDPATFFERQAPRALDEAGPLFRLGLAYAFEVSGPGGGSWSLDLGPAPACRSGRTGSPDCALGLDAADLARALDDPREWRDLFYGGRVRVEGEVQAAAHLPGVLRLLAAERLPGGLRALLGDVPVEEFRTRSWPDEARTVHGPSERLGLGLPALESAEALLERWPGRVRLGDRKAGRLVGRDEARALRNAGEHLAFSDVEHVVPELAAWLDRLRWELDLPLPCHARCLVYASPAGSGEVLHFDQNANFVVQLRGAKRWRLAPNRHAVRPTTRYTSIAPADPELSLYARLPLPANLPEEGREELLRPGSVLFLPRGFWHETRAEEDSLSLNFTFDQPCWADLVAPALRPRLLPDSAWRELATGAGAPRRSAAAAAEARLSALAAAAGGELAGLDAAALLGALRPAGSRNPTEAEPAALDSRGGA